MCTSLWRPLGATLIMISMRLLKKKTIQTPSMALKFNIFRMHIFIYIGFQFNSEYWVMVHRWLGGPDGPENMMQSHKNWMITVDHTTRSNEIWIKFTHLQSTLWRSKPFKDVMPVYLCGYMVYRWNQRMVWTFLQKIWIRNILTWFWI